MRYNSPRSIGFRAYHERTSRARRVLAVNKRRFDVPFPKIRFDPPARDQQGDGGGGAGRVDLLAGFEAADGAAEDGGRRGREGGEGFEGVDDVAADAGGAGGSALLGVF